MVFEIKISEYLSSGLPLIDVRSPGEYVRGHIPEAVNIPLFTNEERAKVGTLYTKVSPEKAVEAGLELVRPKLDWFLEEARRAAPGNETAVHCWRGGLRSRSFANHLSENGFKWVNVITGGDKAYRHHVLRFYEDPPELRIVGGYTGSGKTEIIGALSSLGEQAIDLEGLACHKGSSFGAIGCGVQPTTEQFENNLYEAFRVLDRNRPVWLEDESHNIGGVNLPMALWQLMQKSPTWFIRIPREVRAAWLVKTYAQYGPGVLQEATQRISRRLGSEQCAKAMERIAAGQYLDAALILLTYYDKSYENALHLHQRGKVVEITSESVNSIQNSLKILQYENHRAVD